MPEQLDERLVKVLQAVTNRPETLEEIKERYDQIERRIPKVETSWISRTMLPNSIAQNKAPKEFEELMQELVHFGLVKRSITRYLDHALEGDTAVFSRPEL